MYHYIRRICQEFLILPWGDHIQLSNSNPLLSQFSRLLDQHPTQFASWQLLTFTMCSSFKTALTVWLILFPVHNQMTQNSPISLWHLMLYFNLRVWTWIVSFRPILKAAEHDQGCVVKSFLWLGYMYQTRGCPRQGLGSALTLLVSTIMYTAVGHQQLALCWGRGLVNWMMNSLSSHIAVTATQHTKQPLTIGHRTTCHYGTIMQLWDYSPPESQSIGGTTMQLQT